jgi:uncharacterized protein YdeI (BOF family)
MKKLLIISSMLFMVNSAMANDSSGVNPTNGNNMQQMQHSSGKEQNGQPHRPPKEAVDACQSSSSGASCSFSGREGKQMTGTCWSPDTSKPLACKPAHPPGQQNQGSSSQHQPPQKQ